MGQTMDQMKMLNQLRKAQKDLKNEIVEVEAGDGAVVVQINGELKVKKVTLDPEKIDFDDMQKPKRLQPTKWSLLCPSSEALGFKEDAADSFAICHWRARDSTGRRAPNGRALCVLFI